MTAHAATMATSAQVRPAQNWILNPLQDSLFIIAAPLLALGLALAVLQLARRRRRDRRHPGDARGVHRRASPADVHPHLRRRRAVPALSLELRAGAGGAVRVLRSATLGWINAQRPAARNLPVSLHHAGAVGSVAFPAPALRLHAHLRPPQRGAAQTRRAHGPGAVRELVRVHHARERRVARRHARGSATAACRCRSRWRCRSARCRASPRSRATSPCSRPPDTWSICSSAGGAAGS